jgi:small subunit ribosomal protein S2
MSNISMKSLLEAGVHFGHQTKRWNPKMARFIFGERNNIHIIDLQKTVKELKKAYKYVRDVIASGKGVLFVGTKRQAQEAVREEAERCAMFYINYRWLGGTLTNFVTIRKSINRLKYLENLKTTSIWNKLSKKEISRLEKEFFKLNRALKGIKDLDALPGAVFVIDPNQEKTAVLEARKLGIPVVGIVDTNCDPDMVDIPVPGNDDAIRAIKLFLHIFADAVLEGKQILDKETVQEFETKKDASFVHPEINSDILIEEEISPEIIAEVKKDIKVEE